MIKKIIILLPLILWIALLLMISFSMKSFPNSFGIYIILILNLIATILLIKGLKTGAAVGMFAGLCICYSAQSNWKLGEMELTIGVIYVLMYLIILIALLVKKNGALYNN